MDIGSRGATVGEIIDERPLSRFQTSTIGLCGLVLLLDGFDAQCIGFLAPPIAETLGIPLSAFGPVFAAGLIGLMVASMSIGLVADRWGRKWALIASTLTFGIFSLLTARATSFDQLVLLRFLTGLGLGGAMPNVVALASEYAPKRLQSVLVAMLFAGMPLGALIGSLAAAVMIPAWGWRSVLYLGGILPIAIALALIKALPESVRFLTVRGADPKKIREILKRIAPELTAADINLSVSRDHRSEGVPVKHLFTEGRTVGTVLLWIPFFMNLLILYFIVSWLPALLRQAGMPVSAGVMAISLFSLGGIVGSLAQGRLMNRFGAYRVILTQFGLGTLLVGLLAFIVASFPLMATVTLILGVSVQGAQAGLNALSAMFYPTAIRSTGVGWALGVGRIGSIIGPVLGGILLSIGWGPREIFLAGAVPALCAAAAVMVSNRLRSKASAYRLESEPSRA